jgi:histidine triad (HIT) family protein
LFIPRRHIPSMTDIVAEDGPLLAKIYAVAQRVAHDLKVDESGYRFITNVGPDSGQTVLHLHFHLLGGRRLGWPPG